MLGHRHLAEDARLDPVEDLSQAVARGGDAVVAQADHRVRRVGLAVDQVGDQQPYQVNPSSFDPSQFGSIFDDALSS